MGRDYGLKFQQPDCINKFKIVFLHVNVTLNSLTDANSLWYYPN